MPLVAVICPVLLAFAALSVDIGALYDAKAELQRCADAAALAGAGALIDERRIRNNGGMDLEIDLAARDAAYDYVTRNHVLGDSPTVSFNVLNRDSGDVVLGTLSDLNNYHEPLSTVNPDTYNSVRVRVRRDTQRNGPISLFFARIMGLYTVDVAAEATATFEDGVTGFKVTPNTSNADLIPFALSLDVWNALIAGTSAVGDQYAFDPGTGEVDFGSDGLLEINFFPGAGPTQLPPGNFGTIDIGAHSNATSDIVRQLLEGVNADDLAHHGGELKLGDDGTLTLDGDTGMSVGFKDALEAIVGKPRVIPLFSNAVGTGDTAQFTVVGFAGVRILDVNLTGAPESLYLMIQPAQVSDDAAITEPGTHSSYLVYRSPRLTR